MMRSQGEKWGVDSVQLTPSLYHQQPPPSRSENLLTTFQNVKDVEDVINNEVQYVEDEIKYGEESVSDNIEKCCVEGEMERCCVEDEIK